VQKWLRRWRALPTGANNLNRTAHHSLQIDCETGVGLNGIDPFDPPVEITTEASIWLNTESGAPNLVANLGTNVPQDINTQNDLYTLGVLEDPGLTLALDGPTVIGANPQLMLRWSDDGGHTWNGERTTSMGRTGQYGTRAIFRRLGMTLKLRDRVYEVSGTDPVKVAIMGAELQISPTAS
jgi:hypothetical protein